MQYCAEIRSEVEGVLEETRTPYETVSPFRDSGLLYMGNPFFFWHHGSWTHSNSKLQLDDQLQLPGDAF